MNICWRSRGMIFSKYPRVPWGQWAGHEIDSTLFYHSRFLPKREKAWILRSGIIYDTCTTMPNTGSWEAASVNKELENHPWAEKEQLPDISQRYQSHWAINRFRAWNGSQKIKLGMSGQTEEESIAGRRWWMQTAVNFPGKRRIEEDLDREAQPAVIGLAAHESPNPMFTWAGPRHAVNGDVNVNNRGNPCCSGATSRRRENLNAVRLPS